MTFCGAFLLLSVMIKKQWNLKDAPRRDEIFSKIFRMLRARARFLMKKQRNFKGAPRGSAISSKFSERFARERDFLRHFQDAPRGSAIFSSIFSECSARERDFLQDSQGAPRESPICFKIFRVLAKAGAGQGKLSDLYLQPNTTQPAPPCFDWWADA